MACVHPIREAGRGRQWFCGLSLHTKVSLFETNQTKGVPSGTRQATARLQGRNPATQKILVTRELGSQVRCVHLPTRFDWQTPRWTPDTHRKIVKPEL